MKKGRRAIGGLFMLVRMLSTAFSPNKKPELKKQGTEAKKSADLQNIFANFC